MLTTYTDEIREEGLFYSQPEQTSDIQLSPSINYLLLAIWFVICLIGFAVMFFFRYRVAGAMIIAVPTFLGMIIKPSFALSIFMLVLPTSAGIGVGGFFTLGKGVGIAVAVAFALNLLITRPSLRIRNKTIWIIMSFTLWILLASLTVPHPKMELLLSLTYPQLFIFVLVAYWILETNKEKAFLWVLRSYVIGTLGTIIITFITGAAMKSMADITEQERYGATLGKVVDQNLMASLISLAFLAAVYLFIRDRNVFLRVIYIIAMVFLPIMIVRCGSRGALIALAFTLISPLLFIRQVWQKPGLTVLLLFVIILASGTAAYIIQTKRLPGRVLERLTSAQKVSGAYSYRMELAYAAIHVSLSKPFGSGYTSWFDISRKRHFPHSDFFRALGFYGIPGCVLFTTIIIAMIFTIRRIPLGAEKLYARAVLTFLIVMGLGIGQLTEKYLWVFLTIAMAAERIAWLGKSVPETQQEEGEAA